MPSIAILASCCLVPIKRSSVLASFMSNLSWDIHCLMSWMECSIEATASAWLECALGLNKMYNWGLYLGIIVGGAKRQKLVGSIPIGLRETFWSIIWCFKSKHIVQRVELLVKRRFDFLMDFESYVIYGLCACVILWKSLKLNRTNTLWVNSSTNLLLLPILMSPVSPTPSPLPTGLNSTHSIEERRFQ